MVSEGIFIPRLKLDNITYLQQVHSRCRQPMRGASRGNEHPGRAGLFRFGRSVVLTVGR